MKVQLSGGVIHRIPSDVRNILLEKNKQREVWEDITPLARNEWICWIESARKIETRDRRISIMLDKLARGERRPCCWAGCGHR